METSDSVKNNRRSLPKPFWPVLAILACLIVIGGLVYFYVHSRTSSHLGTQKAIFQSGINSLVVEALDDDLIHFEFSTGGATPDLNAPVGTSPMVLKTDYPGPKKFDTRQQYRLETTDLQVQIEAKSLCVTVIDLTVKPEKLLTKACPHNEMPGNAKILTLTQEGTTDLYGLGEQFLTPKNGNFNWAGQRRVPGNEFGNAMENFFGGYVGNAQFPILYALDSKKGNYALFVDSPYAQTWNFISKPWEMDAHGKTLRWYLLSGQDLPDLRQDFMELTGKPPVPPKKFFGLWVSEYGFDNWGELEDKLRTLRENNFPVDGFVMDLQWFGNISPIEQTMMGNVAWDTKNFPDPPGKIAALKQQGIGLITIEESYVAQRLPEFKDMADRGYLVKECANCGPAVINNGWWGTGGMLDWTNPAGSDYWHDLKRQPLVNMGILGHWTDLGEPEMFVPYGYYFGIPELGLHGESDMHNLYNLRWNESIGRGYVRNHVTQRPFILSRSGTAGIQRYGSSMWSGDIGSNLLSLNAHYTVQGQMSLSGMDYFGSDIGGFHRATAGNDLDEIYTKWLADGSLTDVPVRVHTENVCNCKETAPDRVGDLASNLANLRLRYALSPYYYSLAHRAYLYGEPVVPPLVYAYQNDPNARLISDEKLIGANLLMATLAQQGANQRDVYLPAGKWINFYTNEWIDSQGTWLKDVPAKQDGLTRAPLYARSGAILPMMYVDDKTMNIMGLRSDGSVSNELIVRIYPDSKQSQSILYEDDGQTTAYQQGQVRTTQISQEQTGNQIRVSIEPASGTYQGAPDGRNTVIQLITPGKGIASVKLNGQVIPEFKNLVEFEAAAQGWFNAGSNLIQAKSGEIDVKARKTFEFSIKP